MDRKHEEISASEGQRPADRQPVHWSFQPQDAIGDSVKVRSILQARPDRFHGQRHSIGLEPLQPDKTGDGHCSISSPRPQLRDPDFAVREFETTLQVRQAWFQPAQSQNAAAARQRPLQVRLGQRAGQVQLSGERASPLLDAFCEQRDH